MSKQAKTTIILVLAVLFFMGVLAYTEYQSTQEQLSQQQGKEFISNFETIQVTKVSIQHGEELTEMQKQAEQWLITSADNIAADEDAIMSLIRNAKQLSIQTVISNKADTAQEYGLSQEDRLQVILSDEAGQIAEFYVGKAGAVPQTFYAQTAEQDSVVLVNGNRYSYSKTSWEAPEQEIEETDDAEAGQIESVE